MTEKLRFKLDDRFYQELRERLENRQAWERDAILKEPSRGMLGHSLFQRIRLRALVPEKIPSAAMLRKLIETSFWTSLLREEGRELRFTIKYIHHASDDLLFKEPIDFNVSKLRKLAPPNSEGLDTLFSALDRGRNTDPIGRFERQTRIPFEEAPGKLGI